MLFYKHDQRIVSDNCTKYEQNHHTLLQDITTNTQNLQKNSNNYSNLAQRPMVPHHGTQYEYNPASHYERLHEDGRTD